MPADRVHGLGAVRHVATGRHYRVVGTAALQASVVRPGDGETLVVYRDLDGKLYARPVDEFALRFERIGEDRPRRGEPWTAEREAEIRARLTAATPGPWEVAIDVRPREETVHYEIRTVDPQPEHPWSARFLAWMTGALAHVPPDRLRHLIETECVRPDHQARADAELMAASRTDLEDALDCIDELAAAAVELRETVEGHLGINAILMRKVQTLEAENARLRAELGERS